MGMQRGALHLFAHRRPTARVSAPEQSHRYHFEVSIRVLPYRCSPGTW